MDRHQEELDVSLTPKDWNTCLGVLRLLADTPEAAEDREELERLIARIYKKARKVRRKQSRQGRYEHDRELVAQTGRIRPASPASAAEAEGPFAGIEEFRALKARSRICYVCRCRYREVHHFYHLLCPACARLNFEKRRQTANLSGRLALITGGRVKIGYETALKLLRDGASVAVTTRFPKDAAHRYSAEPDFDCWADRLTIHGIDFLNAPRLVRFIQELNDELPALDILVNNAAQSVRRAPEYYAHLAAIECDSDLTAKAQRLLAADPSEVPPDRRLPALLGGIDGSAALRHSLNRHGEVIDTREHNSWTYRLHEIEPVELLEVLLINTNAPCLLTSGLKPLMCRSSFPDRYVVNVTGSDGQFGRTKPVLHPHVNMSKAALNMMTRTSAADYATDGIFMNSVDTGWITHEAAFSTRTTMESQGFAPPLDAIDGAARIYDPIVLGLQGRQESGCLFRNYSPAAW